MRRDPRQPASGWQITYWGDSELNFTETYEAVELALATGAVPLIIGESGIGKTALIRHYCEEKDLHLVNIDANLLKEGEIGGLPTVEKGRTHYATHHKLARIDELLARGDKDCLLFIDEINRCDHAVQQELMNLILNREINGYFLDDRVIVASAMNPSSRMENFRNTEYQVVEMDPAQENRFVWFAMDADPREWILWGLNDGDIHPQVIEFISSFDEYLHASSESEFIEATPRSWERISHALKVLDDSPVFSKEALYHFVKGNVGASIAQDFMSFLKENDEPFLKAVDIFAMDQLSQMAKDEITGATHSRLYILAMNLIKEMSVSASPGRARRVSEVLLLFPRDLRISLMKEIRNLAPREVYELLLEDDLFLEAFFECFR